MEYVPAKSIVYRDKTYDWFGTEYKMNIYRGCNHGCIYCDSRSDCYRIEEFGRVRAKENALAIIREDLRRKQRPGVVMTGASSDPYNPFEKELRLSRGALELIGDYGFGIGIATKSSLVTRDADLLRRVAENAPVIVKMTITCADDDTAKKLEPAAPPSSERFRAVRELSGRGVYCGLLLMPVMPWLTDTEENILSIVSQAKAAGARFIYASMGLSMRSGQREYLYARFDQQFPGLRERYTARYGDDYMCPSPDYKRLWELFHAACKEAGLQCRMEDIIADYRRGYDGAQLSLF